MALIQKRSAILSFLFASVTQRLWSSILTNLLQCPRIAACYLRPCPGTHFPVLAVVHNKESTLGSSQGQKLHGPPGTAQRALRVGERGCIITTNNTSIKGNSPSKYCKRSALRHSFSTRRNITSRLSLYSERDENSKTISRLAYFVFFLSSTPLRSRHTSDTAI